MLLPDGCRSEFSVLSSCLFIFPYLVCSYSLVFEWNCSASLSRANGQSSTDTHDRTQEEWSNCDMVGDDPSFPGCAAISKCPAVQFPPSLQPVVANRKQDQKIFN